MECVKVGKKTLVASAAFSIAFALGSAFAADEDLGSLAPVADQTIEADIDALDFATDLGTDLETQYISPYSMHSYKHYWGKYRGTVKSTLYWSVIKSSSRVFVSCSEGHLGAAKYTVHNVVPENGRVRVWHHVNWGSPIKLYCDYLVVN
jgi:hypothetical protein